MSRQTDAANWQEVHVLCARSGTVAAIFSTKEDALHAEEVEKKTDPHCYVEPWSVHPAGVSFRPTKHAKKRTVK